MEHYLLFLFDEGKKVLRKRTSVQKSMFCGLSSKYRCGIIKVDPRFVAWL